MPTGTLQTNYLITPHRLIYFSFITFIQTILLLYLCRSTRPYAPLSVRENTSGNNRPTGKSKAHNTVKRRITKEKTGKTAKIKSKNSKGTKNKEPCPAGRKSRNHKKSKSNRRQASPSSSSNSSSDSVSDSDSSSPNSNSSSSSEDDGSNWAVISSIWPVERRPMALQNKLACNKMELSDLLTIAKFDNDNKKALEGDLSSTLTRDKKPRTVKFKSAKDNGIKKLHPARFLRAPLGDIKKWWRHYPRVRSHMYKNLPLRFSGAHNKLTQKTIQSAHDRTKVLNFKMFHTANISVTSKPFKKSERRDEDGVSTTIDYLWESPTTLAQVQEALLNFCSIQQQLWPLDPSGLIMLRIVNKYNFASSASSLSERVALISTYFNMVCRENAARAERKEVVMSYADQEECLKGVLSAAGVNSAVPAGRSSFPPPMPAFAGSSRASFSGNKQPRPAFANSYNGNSSNNGNSTSLRTKVVLFQNHPICFNFNMANCRNQSSPIGCQDANKKMFAHACNKWVAQKQDYCFAKHPRVSNH